MTADTASGPRHKGESRNVRTEPFQETESSPDRKRPSLPMRASLALAMRGRDVDWRTVFDVAGPDADRLASEVEGYEAAMDHLAAHGLPGIEPGWATSVRRTSRRWV